MKRIPLFVVWVLTLVVVLVGGRIVYTHYFPNTKISTIKTDTQAVMEAISQKRLLEARLIGTTSYTPYKPKGLLSIEKDKRKPIDLSENLKLEVAKQIERGFSHSHSIKEKLGGVSKSTLLSMLRICNTTSEDISAENSLALASVYILQGEYTLAIQKLETAIKQSPKNTELLNVLAATYLARAYDEDNSQDLVQALSTISDCVAIDKTSSVLKFNQALIMEKLSLKNTARKVWEEYLKLESDKRWDDEASEHLKILNAPTLAMVWEQERIKLEKVIATEGDNSPTAQQLIEQYPNPARLYALETLFAEWGENYLQNSSVASEKLRVARVIGNALAKLQNDNMIHDAVVVIDKLMANVDSQELEQLAKAHKICKENIIFLDQSKPAKAYEKLKEALPIFTKLGDKASETHTLLHLGRCERGLLMYDTSLKTSSLVINAAEKYSYPYLLGRGWAQFANSYLYQFDLAKSLDACRKAEFYLKSISDWDDLAIIYIIFQFNNAQMRNWNEVFKYNHLALSCFQKTVKELAFPYLFGIFGEPIIQGKKSSASILFYDELINSLITKGINTEIAVVFQRRSFINYKVGNKQAALEDLNQAKKYSQLVDDGKFRSVMEQQINLELAEINIETDPLKAIESLNEVASFFDKTKDRYHKTQTYLTRVQAYLKLERYPDAEQDLKETIVEFEKQRSNVLGETNRIGFFENMITAYDEMIKLQLNYHKDVKNAFNYVEKSRARVLLDIIESIGQKSTERSSEKILPQSNNYPLTISEIQKNLDTSAAIIEYKILPEKLLIWVVKKEKVQFTEVIITQEKMDQLIKDFVDGIQKNSPKEKLVDLSQPLYQMLINPIKPFLIDSQTLVMIPDKSLSFLPFSALINPNTNKFLIEEQPLSTAPSATVFIRCFQKELQFKAKDTILAIGNPKFTRKTFPYLDFLAYAEIEAKGIANLYPNSELLVNEQATKHAFMEKLTNHSIIHFAGHALVNTSSNLSSQLVFAAERGETGLDTEALYAYELYRYRFDKTKMVILSACQTANGQNVQGEGVINIARPFLAGGVPCVIANLWNAEDEVSKELLINFHKNFFNGQNSLEALQKAQIALINSPNPKYRLPQMWAPVVAIGSEVNYRK
jgi:CHAT domain-containing protein